MPIPSERRLSVVSIHLGAVAHLGERLICIQEVESSILFSSTIVIRAEKISAFFIADRFFRVNRSVRLPGKRNLPSDGFTYRRIHSAFSDSANRSD